uniref:DH domain-containing protein n=1 Tax=Trichobilharzia regenti TaxID=157069 RepID=A0AA85JJY1_TRIRE|nr:unnamed protein product [Trichobilharzia regenti]
MRKKKNRSRHENSLEGPEDNLMNSSQTPPPQQQQQQHQRQKSSESLNQHHYHQQQQQQHHHKHLKYFPRSMARSVDSLFVDSWNKKVDIVQNLDSVPKQSLKNQCIIRFWNGGEIKVQLSPPLPPSTSGITTTRQEETIGDVVRSQISDYTIPIQCIDCANKESIPWGTPMSNLASKTLLIKKIHRNRSSFTLQYPGNAKKLERRSAPPLDTSDALKQWFNFYKKNTTPIPQLSLADQLVNECLNELDSHRVEQLFPRRRKNSDCSSPQSTITPITNTTNIISSTVTSPITMTATEEMIRNKSSSYSRVESGHHRMSISQEFDSQELNDLFFIEESWEQIVQSSAQMTRHQQKRQSAIWEFFHTEANYLKYLRTIIDFYLSPFLDLSEHLFDNLDSGWIFGNIEEVYKANVRLWLQYLIEPLREIRQTGCAFTPVIFKSAITHIPDLFSVYKQYYVNLPRCRSYTQEAIRQSTNFCTFLEWADQQGHDHREPLWDQMTKPTTRLTQYRLLMESILKNCINSTEEQEVNEMLKSISEFIETINRRMTETKTWESLEILASKLIYDDLLENVVEDYTQLINDHTKFKFSILGPIKLPLPVVLFHDANNAQNMSLTTKSLTSLRNRRSSGSSLINFSSTTDVRNFQPRSTTSCNRSDSGIGDCNPPASASTDITSPMYFKQTSKNFSLPAQTNEIFQCPVLLSRVSPGGVQKSGFLEADINDSVIYDWSDFYCQRTVQRAVLYGGSLRFKEPPSRSVETVCHILTDLFLITKTHKKDGNDYWKLLKNPVRLDKLVIQRGRDSGVFGCAVLDDFQNISNLYIFSAGHKCDEWIAQIESAKENYRRLMEPEILIAQPIIIDQKDESSTILMPNDITENSSELHNHHQHTGEGSIAFTIGTTATASTSSSADNPTTVSNVETSKRNVFFSSQSHLYDSSHCNTVANHPDDAMSISDKRIRSITSPAIVKTNARRSSSRSHNDNSLTFSPTKMSNSTSERNIFSHFNNTSDRCCTLNSVNSRPGLPATTTTSALNINHDEKSKSTSVSPRRKDRSANLSYQQEKYNYLPPSTHRNDQRSSNNNSSMVKMKPSNSDMEKGVSIINVRQTVITSPTQTGDSQRKLVRMDPPFNSDDTCLSSKRQGHTENSSTSLKYSTNKSSEGENLSENEVRACVNRPSILIYKIQSDPSESNSNSAYLNSIGLRRQSVHQSLLSIERSDSSDDQITVKS